MHKRKIVSTDGGKQVWRNNKLIAYVDENDILFAEIHGIMTRLDYADSDYEILSLLDHHGV